MSLLSCHLPTAQKLAIVHPRLNKPTLDASKHESDRPISVTARFTAHAEDHELFPMRQSAYRRHHSTETVVSVLNNIIRAADDGKVTCLVLLDLSAAFDTVDHDILLDVLRRRFLVEEPALKWFHSYLNDRTQVISVNDKESAPIPVACSVLQGSVIGPVQFISYSEDVVVVFNAHHHVQYHIFADDNQLFASAPVAEAHEAKKTVKRALLPSRTGVHFVG